MPNLNNYVGRKLKFCGWLPFMYAKLCVMPNIWLLSICYLCHVWQLFALLSIRQCCVICEYMPMLSVWFLHSAIICLYYLTLLWCMHWFLHSANIRFSMYCFVSFLARQETACWQKKKGIWFMPLQRVTSCRCRQTLTTYTFASQPTQGEWQNWNLTTLRQQHQHTSSNSNVLTSSCLPSWPKL